MTSTWHPSTMVAGQSGGVRYSPCYAANTYKSINKFVCYGRPSIRMWLAASSAEFKVEIMAEISGMEFEIKCNVGRHWTCPSSFLFDDPGKNQRIHPLPHPPNVQATADGAPFHKSGI